MQVNLLATGLIIAPLMACSGSDKAVVQAPAAGIPDKHDATARENSAPPPAEGLPSPEGAPDRTQDPVGFLQWRIDQMFQRQDVNVDGQLEAHEYQGPPGTEAERLAHFARIDADHDGRISQEEVMASMVAENPELLEPSSASQSGAGKR